MKRLLLIPLLLLICSAVQAQPGPQSQLARYEFSGTGAPSLNCSPGPPWRAIYINVTDNSEWQCTALNTWTKVVSGGTPGTVTSVSGTANQISVATGSTTPVVSIPSALVIPGTLASPASDPADAGVIRLGNAELIEWEKFVSGTDWTFGVNASDQLESTAPLKAPSFVGTVSAASVSGVIPIANLATGTPNGSKFIRDDGTLQTPPTTTPGGSSGDIQTNNGAGGFGSITPGTGVATALAVNVGSAGASVVNGGALGTPSSGVATNLTGTAAGLTAGNVTTNANLTGDVTSTGNATAIASGVIVNTDVNASAAISATKLVDGTVSDAELQFINTLGSNAQTQIDAKAALASPTFTGTPTLPTGTIATTQSAADSSTKVATTAFVTTADSLKANLASPTFTGTVALPTGVTVNANAMTFPTTVATLARTDAGQTLSGTNIFTTPTDTQAVKLNASASQTQHLLKATSDGTNVRFILDEKALPRSRGAWFGGTSSVLTGAISYDDTQFGEGPMLNIVSGASIRGASNFPITWNSTSSNANGSSADTGISRDSAGVIAIGTGTAGSTAGSLKATGGTFSGALINTGITTDAAHVTSTVCQDTTTHQFYFGSATLGVCLGTSSARFKNNLRPLNKGLDQILALHPKSFFYNQGYGDNGANLQYGFTAEDVVKTMPEAVGLDGAGRPNSVDMLKMFPVMVNAIGNLNTRLEKLERENKRLRALLRHRRIR